MGPWHPRFHRCRGGTGHRFSWGLIMKGTYPRLRIWVRVVVNDAIDRHVPLELPGSSTFADIHDEVVRVTNAPNLPGPWELTSPTGRPLSPDAHLGDLLRPGGTVILRPQQDPSPPVFRDAAEELAAEAGPEDLPPSPAFTWATIAAGILALTACTLLMPLPTAIDHWWWLRGGLAALIVLIAAVALRLPWMSLTGTLLATAFIALGTSTLGIPQAILATGTAFTLAALACRHWQLSWRAGVGATGLGLALSGGALWTLSQFGSAALRASTDPAGTLATGAALACVIATIGALLSARISTGLAGVRPPLIPGAGEDFSVGDETTGHADAARAARAIHCGITAGIAALVSAAAAALPLLGSWTALVLLFTLALGLGLHAQRIPHRVVGPVLHGAAVACLCATVPALAMTEAHPGWWTLPVLLCAGLLTVPLWQQPWRRVLPTTTVWLERAESLAIILSIPVGLLCAGVFQAIRELAL